MLRARIPSQVAVLEPRRRTQVARNTIAADSTLEDVQATLLDPEKHVRNVLLTMGDCRKEHGNAHVRIGVTGEGKTPYHKVIYFDAEGREHLFGSYDGLKKDENYQVHEATWSTRSSSYDDVRQLLGRIRGFLPKKPS
jgi:hypothetical protein